MGVDQAAGMADGIEVGIRDRSADGDSPSKVLKFILIEQNTKMQEVFGKLNSSQKDAVCSKLGVSEDEIACGPFIFEQKIGEMGDDEIVDAVKFLKEGLGLGK